MSTMKAPVGVYNYYAAVNQGLIDRQSMVHKFGHSSTVPTTLRHIWNDPTGANLVWQQTASTYDVVSSSANDAAAGTGARKVLIEGLDANFNPVSEEVTMNGITPVTTTQTFIRAQRAYVTDCGTYSGSNEGNISISVSGGTLQAYINFSTEGEGQTQKSQYTVPAGYTAYIVRVSITIETGKTVTADMHVRGDADVTSAPMTAYRILHKWDGLDSPVDETFFANHIIEEKSDIWFEAKVSSGTASVEVDYDILLVEN